MGLLEEIEDLQGDLVLQQVMLSSIEGEAADEFEDERKQRREEIAEIKKKLAKLKHRRDTMVERNDSGRLTRLASVNGWAAQVGSADRGYTEGNIRDASAPPTAQPSPGKNVMSQRYGWHLCCIQYIHRRPVSKNISCLICRFCHITSCSPILRSKSEPWAGLHSKIHLSLACILHNVPSPTHHVHFTYAISSAPYHVAVRKSPTASTVFGRTRIKAHILHQLPQPTLQWILLLPTYLGISTRPSLNPHHF